jgi:hypothetical protein
MSKNKSINKLLKKSAKTLDKSRNPLDKLARLGVNTSDIAHRVVRNGIGEVKTGIDSIVDISTKRLRSAQDEKKLKDIVQAQLDFTSSDVRALVDVAREGIDTVADGIVDALDEVSNTYDAYRADAKAKTFKHQAKKPASEKAA